MNNTFRLVFLLALFPNIPTLAAPVSTNLQQPVSLMALAGYVPLRGEGVVVTLSDQNRPTIKNSAAALPGLVHDYDVLSLVNELRSAGAQGITVGGVRLTNQSSINCIGPRLLVDKTPVPIPLRIEAVGNSALLKAHLGIKGGVLDSFKTAGPHAVVSINSKLQLSAAPLPTFLKAPQTSN
ncbi:hypothetical protein IAD21_03760 [Abditibacteriota bacterium]|nr:hypothetical protein IAD21_03760 [Abditibacteriota bacterium]